MVSLGGFVSHTGPTRARRPKGSIIHREHARGEKIRTLSDVPPEREIGQKQARPLPPRETDCSPDVTLKFNPR